MRASYVMLGGFLGAGKTTAALRYAQHLRRAGRSVGLITNDQSVGLVDSAVFGSRGFGVAEISGGCFCCRFNSLVEAAERLSVAGRPDVFVAEPVGSCTDLRAAVSYPLRQIYGEEYRVAPLSVLIDPRRALRVLAGESGRSFSEKVVYIYRKQLEEAHAVVINKSDLLSADLLCRLQEVLAREFAGARQFVVSARQGTGLAPWFRYLEAEDLGTTPPPALDYDLYADGESRLGWLNVRLEVEGTRPMNGNRVLLDLAERIRARCPPRGVEVAHLKMTLDAHELGTDLAVVNWVGSGSSPELFQALKDSLVRGELLLNLRAEGDPAVVRELALEALGASSSALGYRFAVAHLESFRPPRPEPTHRMAL